MMSGSCYLFCAQRCKRRTIIWLKLLNVRFWRNSSTDERTWTLNIRLRQLVSRWVLHTKLEDGVWTFRACWEEAQPYLVVPLQNGYMWAIAKAPLNVQRRGNDRVLGLVSRAWRSVLKFHWPAAIIWRSIRFWRKHCRIILFEYNWYLLVSPFYVLNGEVVMLDTVFRNLAFFWMRLQ